MAALRLRCRRNLSPWCGELFGSGRHTLVASFARGPGPTWCRLLLRASITRMRLRQGDLPHTRLKDHFGRGLGHFFITAVSQNKLARVRLMAHAGPCDDNSVGATWLELSSSTRDPDRAAMITSAPIWVYEVHVHNAAETESVP